MIDKSKDPCQELNALRGSGCLNDRPSIWGPMGVQRKLMKSEAKEGNRATTVQCLLTSEDWARLLGSSQQLSEGVLLSSFYTFKGEPYSFRKLCKVVQFVKGRAEFRPG